MNEQSVETSSTPEVHVEVNCDAKIQGWDKNQVFAESPEGAIEMRQIENVVTLECNDDCAVFVPMDAKLHVRKVGSDCRLKDMRAPTTIGDVGGDLVVRATAQVNISNVGGDLSARGVSGDLSVSNVGGDFSARELTGSVAVSNVGGDLDLDTASLVTLSTTVGGDANVRLRPEAGSQVAVNAGGDIVCELPPGTNARITVNDGRGRRVLRVGDGLAEVVLNCGGTASVKTNGGERVDETNGKREERRDERGERVFWGANLGDDISSRIQTEMSRNAQRMAEKMQRQAERQARHAERQAQHAARHAARQAERAARQSGHGRPGFDFNFGFGPGSGFGRPPQPPRPPEETVVEPVSDQERMAILKMLEDKKITADQAEQLLRALG